MITSVEPDPVNGYTHFSFENSKTVSTFSEIIVMTTIDNWRISIFLYDGTQLELGYVGDEISVVISPFG